MKETDMITRKQILKELGNSHLDLELANGYVYFIYDDLEKNIYETHSVYVAKLNHLSYEAWITIGKKFLVKIKTLDLEEYY